MLGLRFIDSAIDRAIATLALRSVKAASACALYYLEVQASRYLERRLVNNARKTLEKQLDGNRTSKEHKVRIRKKLEELEEAVASA
ncbi:hypothetical protein EV652_10362 [Kribbella steppae]|uniref:Uncharacterized protein n=1 Tax=Kribbella steppae TaxID=2512223 RepID=A0A4R2HPE0_9ACTN|nr:hypothetical protein EV652_10362 [Kribbella steppae]